MKRKANTLKLSNRKTPMGLGFSLNYTRRFDHSKRQIQTPFRGNAPRGHGGPIRYKNIIKSQYVCSDAFNIPHVSVKNNRGMISTRYKWINRRYPYTVVKNPKTNYDMRLQLLKNNNGIKVTNTSSYANYLNRKKPPPVNHMRIELLKNNHRKESIKLKTDNETSNKCPISGHNNTVKEVNPLSYENYLNRKKANITKKNKLIAEPNESAKTGCDYEPHICNVNDISLVEPHDIEDTSTTSQDNVYI